MPLERLVTSFVQLPGWLIYLMLGVLAFASALIIQWIGGQVVLRCLRREQPEHWAERARLAFPYATFSMIHLTMVSAGWLLGGIPVWKNVWAPLPLVCAACLGILICSRPTWRHLRGRPSHGAEPQRPLAWIQLSALNAAAFLLPVLVILSLPRTPTPQVWLTIAAMTVAIIAYRLWFSVPIARAIGVLRPAPDALQQRVGAIAAECGIARPTAYAIRAETANAFALVTCHSLGFTEEALEILSPAEQDTIIRHELAHLTESRPLRWLRLLNILIYVPLMSIPPLIGLFGPGGVWIGLLAYFTLSRLWGNFSRELECRADREASTSTSAASSDRDLVYASALEKLYRHNLVPAVMRGRGTTHPNLYDRLIAAGATPDFPRPQPPPRAPLAIACVLALAGLIAMLKLLRYLEPVWA